jgi:hypothetical protein
LSALLTEGGDGYVVVRADVVEGDYNLVVPVDAVDAAAFDSVLSDLSGKLNGQVLSGPTVLHVTDHYPLPPHCSHTFVAGGEFERFPLPEYAPPGRHPQSPGYNPWG